MSILQKIAFEMSILYKQYTSCFKIYNKLIFNFNIKIFHLFNFCIKYVSKKYVNNLTIT